MRDYDGIDDQVEAALKTADERNRILEIMRHALLSGDDATVLQLANRLCGVETFDIPKPKRAKRRTGISLLGIFKD